MDKGASASRPGSREPSPKGLGPLGFDPSRDDEAYFRCGHLRSPENSVSRGGGRFRCKECRRPYKRKADKEGAKRKRAKRAERAEQALVERVGIALVVASRQIEGDVLLYELTDDEIRMLACAAVTAMRTRKDETEEAA
jgi:hypothetical protein